MTGGGRRGRSGYQTKNKNPTREQIVINGLCNLRVCMAWPKQTSCYSGPGEESPGEEAPNHGTSEAGG